MYRFKQLISVSVKLSLRNDNTQVVEALAGGEKITGFGIPIWRQGTN